MATRGTWKITKFKHTGEDKSVKIPVKFIYGGASKTIEVTGEEQDIIIDMPWSTEFGDKINVAQIICSGEKTVDDKEYVVTNKNLNAITLKLDVTTPIESTATSISYTANSDASVTAKYNDETRTTSSGSFTVPENTGQTSKRYVISAFCTEYPDIVKDAKEIIQKGTIPDPTISITSPSPISSGETALTYTVVVDPADTPVTVKYAGETKQTKTGTFEIPVNTGTTVKYHPISAYCTEKTYISALTIVEQEKGEPAYVFEVSPTEHTFPSTGGSFVITINNPNNYSWQITGLTDNWISASKMTGNTSETITVTATANDEFSIRNGNFHIKETTKNRSNPTIEVEQEAKKETKRRVKFTFNNGGSKFYNNSNEGSNRVTIMEMYCTCTNTTTSEEYWTAKYNEGLDSGKYLLPTSQTKYPSAEGWLVKGASNMTEFVAEIPYGTEGQLEFDLFFGITWQGGSGNADGRCSCPISDYNDETNGCTIELPEINWRNE